MNPRLLYLLLGIATLGYVIDLGGSSIWDANEAFYVETPREMVESGDYVNPTFNYEPRFNKPVLSYWLVAGLYHVFGVSVTVQRAAIVGSALAMVLAAMLLARMASRHALAPALAAAGLLANPRFFMFSRRILIDVFLAALMTGVLLCFALSEWQPARRRQWLIGMYVFVGLAVLAKGPVAVALPGLVCACYLVFHRELSRVRTMMMPAGALIVLAIVAPWYIALYAGSGWAHISEFFIGENLERYTSLVGPQSRGPLFYLPVVFSDGLPWSLALVGVVVAWFRETRAQRSAPDGRIRTLLLFWMVAIVGFFSLSQTKQDLYIFPIAAAVAALGGDFVARGLRDGADERRWLGVTLAFTGVVLALLGAGALYVFERAGMVYRLDGAGLAGVVAVAGGLAVAAAAWKRPGVAAFTVLAVLVSLDWTLLLKVLPSFERYKPVVPLSQAILEQVREGDRVVHYDVALPSMVFYLRRHVEMFFDPEPFIGALGGSRDVFTVLPEHRYQELRDRMPRPTCVLARQATFDAKLREVLSLHPPPAILLVSTRCPF